MAAIIGDALRQAFMPKREYESLREEDRAWSRLQRPILASFAGVVCLVVIVSTVVALHVVFPADASRRPLCGGEARPLSPLQVGGGKGRDSDLFPGAFYLTDQEAVDYFWFVVFVPSLVVFLFTAVYLIAGIAAAFSAPSRTCCLNVVENNYCASKRGGLRCLSIMNTVFAIIFGLLAVFLGSSLLTLGNSCSSPLFWCYELASWGLVILYGGTAFFLRRRAAVILDDGDFSGRNRGVEMLEAHPVEITPEVERRVSEGFKAWMGSSLLSSDEEEDDDEPNGYQYHKAPHLTRTNSNRETI